MTLSPRLEAFELKYGAQFAPASRATAQFTVITGVVGGMAAEREGDAA